MTIAVNTRFLAGELEGFGHYVVEIFRRITADHPEHSFVFIFDRPFRPTFDWPPNVRAEVIGPPARHPLLWKFWYDYRIPPVLRRCGADLFISADGFCSLRTKLPQCLVVHDLDFLHHPGFNKRSHVQYYKRYTPRCLAKAEAVVTVSNFSRNDILARYGLPADKLHVIYNGIREGFRPLGSGEKENVKDRYTAGREFFLYAGAIHPRKNLVNLLKAFSLFKKRQHSGMKLVLAGRLAWMGEPLLESLRTYKYRNDVVVTGYLEEHEFCRLMGSAYALVYPSLLEGFGMPVAEAMRCGVPVITSRGTAMEEISAGAALLADPLDPSSIAEQMMLLYKDENFRSGLIEKGTGVSKKYNWDEAAAAFWKVIMGMVPAVQTPKS
jgi:glycosyltransferase involved in cell wall biosynthesis